MASLKNKIKGGLTNSFGGLGVAGIGLADAAKDAIERQFVDPNTRGSSGRAAAANKSAGTDAQLALAAFNNNAGVAQDNITAANSTSNTSAGTAAAKKAADDLRKAGLTRNEARSLIQQLMAAYDQNFGMLDELARDRERAVDADAGEQINALTGAYTASIPEIEKSYAAIGAGDSTDRSDAKDKAKTGFDESTGKVKKNTETQKATIGNYVNEQKAKFNADRDKASRLNARLDETDDLSQLNQARNDVEDSLDSARSIQGTLGTDAGARGELAKLTDTSNESAGIMSSLDQILKGSLSGATKAAAVQAVVDAGGLTDTDKQKIKATYGDVYGTPVAG